jgi:cytochrome c biogenesis protein CcdA
LPLLPVIIGGTASDDGKNKYQPLIITGSLALSIFIFTMTLRATTAFIGIPQEVWQIVSGGLVIALGAFSVWPELWEKITIKTGFSNESNKLLYSSANQKGIMRPILIGASLGPVFTSCSPTYGFILATVLPQSFADGLVNIIAYTLGLAIVMLIVSYAGQQAIKNLGWATDPKGKFRRGLGIVFIIVGLLVLTGFYKTIETWIVDQGFYDSVIEIENKLR